VSPEVYQDSLANAMFYSAILNTVILRESEECN